MNEINGRLGAEDDQTVLIVDDNATNIRVLTTLLEGQGFTTLIARNGTSAIETANYANPDLILLDVMMPGIDGFETCRRLKASSETNDIPIIFMTALSHTENKVKGFQVGAVDYVVKPLQHEEVIARVSTHLRLQALTRNLKQQNDWLMEMTLQQKTIEHLGQQILSILDYDRLLPTITDLIQSHFSYYFVGLWLKEVDQDGLTLRSASGSADKQLPALGQQVSSHDSDRQISFDAFQQKQILFVNDLTQDKRYSTLHPLTETRAMLSLPLKVGNISLGALEVHSCDVDAFAVKGKMVMVTLANQIAIAIRNAKRYREDTMTRRRY